MEVIPFYEKNQPFYEFSNFAKAKFQLDGMEWANSEHYFQCQKFYVPESPRHMEYYRILCQADSPMKVFMLAKQTKKGGYASKWVVNKKTCPRLVNDLVDEFKDLPLRSDWGSVRLDVMRKALYAKFTQMPKYKDLLLSTGDSELQEASPRDSFWGTGKDGKGENHLGKLLMELRGILVSR